MAITFYGVAALTFMMTMYALEGRGRAFVLLFALGCALSSVNVELTPTARGYDIEARVRTMAQTGVEMEALTAVAVAALTIYDMLKAVDRSMVIGELRLVFKRGGKTTYVR